MLYFIALGVSKAAIPILQMREYSSGEANDLSKDTQPETANLRLEPRASPFKFCVFPHNGKLVSGAQKRNTVLLNGPIPRY